MFQNNSVYWVVKPQGALVFPAVDHVRELVVSGVKQGKPQALVLDFSQVTRSDFTAAQVTLRHFLNFRRLKILLLNQMEMKNWKN